MNKNNRKSEQIHKKQIKNPWHCLSSKLIYKNRWLKLREDRVIRPDNTKGIYGVVEISPAIGVVALTQDQKVIFVGQWRYTHNKYSWEIPLGGKESGESFLQASKRELEEETGYKAKTWYKLGVFESSNCLTTDKAVVYAAEGLVKSKKESLISQKQEGISSHEIPLIQAANWVMKGKITESISIGAILMFLKLKEKSNE